MLNLPITDMTVLLESFVSCFHKIAHVLGIPTDPVQVCHSKLL